jgi:hypothetical protein
MKRLLNTMLLGALLLYTAVAHAQTPANTLPELLVELWPDYDEPSVLVLLTGALPADAALPATLTLPLPEDAALNAVASIDATGAMLNTDYTAASGFVTLTTPDPRFRVEYYVPYRVTGAERAYTFRWEAGLDVAQLILRVQEPAAAANLTITPAAERSVSDRGDGLAYHLLAPQFVPAGQAFTASLSYTLAGDVLTAAPAGTAPASAVPAAAPAFDWTLVLALAGGVLLGGAITWLAWTQLGGKGRGRSRVHKPRPQRSNRASAVAGTKFCHNCGQPTQPGDGFCRSCGTPLKKK